MTALSWANGVTGNWNDKTKWNFGIVPTSSDDVTVGNTGAFVVAVSTADVANSLTFSAANATLSETTAGSLNIAGALTLQAGTIALHHANTIGSVDMTGGVMQLFVGNALGSGTVTLDGGELSGMASETNNNSLAMGGTGAIIDAATGTTLNLANGNWSLDATSSPTLQFGSATRKGVVDWHTNLAFISFGGGAYTVDVAGGTLRAADSFFGFLTQNAASTTVAAGAKIDLNGFSATAKSLFGAGSIVNAGASALLSLGGGNFGGVISGNLSTDITGTTEFTNVNTYTGSTSIETGQVLFLLTKGSVAGSIIDNGTLYVDDSSGTFTTGLISGTGLLDQVNVGTLVLGHANTFSGGANIDAGKTLVGNGKGFGSGALGIANATVIGTVTETVANTLTLQGADTLAAATGTTFTLTGGSSMTWDAASNPLTLTFGDAADKGTVVMGGAPSLTYNSTDLIHVKVAYGTLRGAKGALGFFLGGAADVTVAAGATLDLGGSSTILPTLTSPGSITNSSVTMATMYTENTSSVSGVISGKLALNVINGALTLSGANTYVGGTTISSGATLTLTGAGSIKGAIADGGALVLNESGPETFAAVISGAGSLTQSGVGVTTLSGANTYTGGTVIQHGKFVVTNGKALGTQGVELDNGTELQSTATMALAATGSGTFTLKGATTIAAAHLTTLTIGGAEAVNVQAGVMNFGEGANDGTVVFKVNGGSTTGLFSIKVNVGTLRAGDTVFGALTSAATSVTVAAGATLDLGGFGVTAQHLLGTGKVIDSGASAILLDEAGTFGGVISGNLKFEADNVTLTGANTFTGGTTINSGSTLQLGAGGATGSIVGAVLNSGTLVVNETGTVSLAGAISGTGVVSQNGAGVTILSGASTYSGGTNISRGMLESTRSSALGTGGAITMTGGELLATANQIQAHDFSLSGASTIAVATGSTLILNSISVSLNTGTTYFGDATHAGTIIWNISTSLSTTVTGHLEVRDGTLKVGTGLAVDLTSLSSPLRIDTGGTFDIAGHSTGIRSLTGAGVLTNSGAATALFLEGSTTYGGVISGHFTEINIDAAVTLTGNETFTGKAVISGSQSLTLSGLFGEDVQFSGTGTLALAIPSRFTGTVQSFQSGSTVDLENITTGASATLAYDTGTGVLTVKDGTHTDTIKFGAGLVLGNFVAAADGSGGTDINWQTPPPAPVAAPAAAPAAQAPAPVAKAPATHTPLVDAIASFQPPYTAATMLIPPPATAFQTSLAMAH